MDKNTLSQYGWVVIAIIVIVILITLATPFGKYIGNAVQSSTNALYNKTVSTFNKNNIKIDSLTNTENTPKLIADTSLSYTHNVTIIDNSNIVTGFDGIVYGFDIYDTFIVDKNLDYYTDVFSVSNGGKLQVVPSPDTYDNIGTGVQLKVLDKDNNHVKTYVIIIFGDLDGDGLITASDAAIIEFKEAYIADIEEGTPAYVAADVTLDGFIDLDDSSTIERDEAYYDGIDQKACGDYFIANI